MSHRRRLAIMAREDSNTKGIPEEDFSLLSGSVNDLEYAIGYRIFQPTVGSTARRQYWALASSYSSFSYPTCPGEYHHPFLLDEFPTIGGNEPSGLTPYHAINWTSKPTSSWNALHDASRAGSSGYDTFHEPWW